MKKLVAVSVVVAVGLVGTACTSDFPDAGPGRSLPLTISWPQYGASPDHSDLRVSGPPPPLVRYWTFSAGGILPQTFWPPVTSNGRIFVSGETLFALDSRGEEQWRYEPDDVFLLSNPVVVGEEVIIAWTPFDHERVVLEALDVESGDQVWERSIDERGIFTAGLVASDRGLLVIGERRGSKARRVTGTNLWLVAVGGDLLWSAATNSPAVVDTSENDAGPVAAAARGVAVVPVQNGVEAFSLSSGQRLWTAGRDRFIPFGPSEYWNLVPVAIVGRKAFVLSEGAAGISRFRALSLRAGRVLFERKGDTIGSGVSTFVAAGDRLYLETGFGPRPHHLIVLDAGDFSIERRTAFDPRFELLAEISALPTPEGLVAVAGDSLVHLNKRGHLTWKTRIRHRQPFPLQDDAPVPTGLVPTGGGFLVTTSDGLIHAYGPP